jgi:hypothetical protein
MAMDGTTGDALVSATVTRFVRICSVALAFGVLACPFDDAWAQASPEKTNSTAETPPSDASGGEAGTSESTWRGATKSHRYAWPEDLDKPPPPPKATPSILDWGPYFSGAVWGQDAATYAIAGLGVSAGATFARRLHAVVTMAFPVGVSARVVGREPPYKKPDMMIGARLGGTVIATRTFGLGAAAIASTTTSPDLGWNVGVAVPLDWVTHTGFRFGLSLGLMRTFGSSSLLACGGAYDDRGNYVQDCSTNRQNDLGVDAQAHAGFNFK